MEDGDNIGTCAEDNALIKSLIAGGEDPVLAQLREAAAALEAQAWDGSVSSSGIPIGSAVEVTGLRSRSGIQYNGVTGVVVAPIEGGRQGIRLDAPFRYERSKCSY